MVSHTFADSKIHVRVLQVGVALHMPTDFNHRSLHLFNTPYFDIKIGMAHESWPTTRLVSYNNNRLVGIAPHKPTGSYGHEFMR